MVFIWKLYSIYMAFTSEVKRKNNDMRRMVMTKDFLAI